MGDKLEELENLIRMLPEERRAGVAWVLENMTTLDRIFCGEKLTDIDKDNIALDAAIRHDYHMLALILYRQIRDFEQDHIGISFDYF